MRIPYRRIKSYNKREFRPNFIRNYNLSIK
jgi:hypothetical protein